MEEPKKSLETQALVNITWRLTAFVDMEACKTRKPKSPLEDLGMICEECFTIKFTEEKILVLGDTSIVLDDYIFLTRGFFRGTYNIDYQTSKCKFSIGFPYIDGIAIVEKLHNE